MSGLLFLGNDDFTLMKGTKGNILCSSIPGYSLILFYSTQCPHCQKLIPIFKKLPGSIGGCQFGMINVSTNKNCIRLSNDTIAPITYVPYIVLYINGRPFMRYLGPHDANELKKFIIEVAQKMDSKQKFTNQGNILENRESTIPAYTIGVPLFGCDDGQCTYLNFNEAYQ
jgi:hypothetical protein